MRIFGDSRVKMCARLTPKYEEDVCGIKVESEQQLQLLGGVCKQPRIVLHTAGMNISYSHLFDNYLLSNIA